MNVEEFVKDRLEEMKHNLDYMAPNTKFYNDLHRILNTMYDMVELHKNWPVLVTQEPPKIQYTDLATQHGLAIHVAQKIEWMTQKEYVERFGNENGMAPFMRSLAKIWSGHPDFDPDWR